MCSEIQVQLELQFPHQPDYLFLQKHVETNTRALKSIHQIEDLQTG